MHRALATGAHVTPEEAVRRAHAATLYRIGRGGLNEAAAETDEIGEDKGRRRQQDTVSDAQVHSAVCQHTEMQTNGMANWSMCRSDSS